MMHPKAFLFALAALFAAIAAPADAALPPRPDKAVYDGADIIPAQDEAALDQRLAEYVLRTGNTVVVATVPSLDGDAIEPYAAKLFETWGIGGAERDTGALLLVAPNEHKVRIEVGYGLTPYITDILSGRIIRNDITPRFKAGDLPGGINAGVNAITTQLDRSPEDARAIADAAATAQKNRHDAVGPTIFGVIFWIVMMVVFIGFFARRNGGRRYRGSGGIGSAVGNVVLWTALNAATRGNNSGWGGGGGGFGGGGGGFGGGGGGFGGFGGGMSGGGGASGSW